jgi:transposase
LDTNFWGFFMTKYDVQLKLRAVRAYLRGTLGYERVARRYGVSEKRLRAWVAGFQSHGAEALRKKHSRYDAAFRLQVLQYVWDNEVSYSQAAAHFDIRSPTSIGAWEREYRAGGLDRLVPRPRGRPQMPLSAPAPEPKKDEDKSREELIAELNHVRMELAYRKKLQALVQARPKTAAPKKKRASSSN